MDELLFTPAAVLDLLCQIDELGDLDIGVAELQDNQVQITVGSSVYIISSESAPEIKVDDSALDIIDEANMDVYESLSESGDIELHDVEDIKGGVIKEVAKTLLVGGLVRLTSKLLRK